MQYGFKGDVNYTVRLRGHKDSGWKGREDLRGTVRFTGPPQKPTYVNFSNLPYLFERFGAAVTLLDMSFDPSDMSFSLTLASGDVIHLQLHRKDQHLLARVEEGLLVGKVTGKSKSKPKKGFTKTAADVGSAAKAAAAYVMDILGKGKKKFLPSGEELAYLSALEGGILQSDLDSDRRACLMAAGLIRCAVRNPGAAVAFTPLPAWMPQAAYVKAQLIGLLATTGLGRFATFTECAFRLDRPTDGPEVYEFVRLSEQWRAPLHSFNLDAVPSGVLPSVNGGEADWGTALRSALDQKDAENGQGPTPLDMSTLQ
jgi:hypothetical protein